MATLGELNVVIGAEIDDFEAKMARVQSGIGRVGDYAKSAGQALSTYITLPLGLLASSAVTAAARMDSLRRGLQAVTQQQLSQQGVTGLTGIAQAATDTQKRLVELREVSRLPGLSFSEAVQGDIRLRAVGISADLSKRALLAFGNAVATTGGGASELGRVTVQLGQLSAKGKVLAQDLRPIIEAAPAVATALKNLYGTVDSETISDGLAKQGKSSTDFIDALTTELGKLPSVTGGLKNAFENLSDSAELNLARLGESINQSFGLEALADKVAGAIGSITDAFLSLSPSTQKLILGFVGVVAAAGPVLFAVGAIGAAVPAISAGFAVLGVTSIAALGPIALVAAGVAAALYLVYENAGAIGEYFGSGEGGAVLRETRTAFDDLSEAVGRFSGLLSGVDSKGLPLPNVLLGTQLVAKGFELMGDQITSKLGLVSGVLNGISGLLNRDLATTVRGVTQVAEGLIPPLATIGRLLRKDVQEGFEGAAGGGGIFGDELLHLSGLLPAFNSQLQGFAGGLPQFGANATAQAGLLEVLRKRLEEVKDAREKETTAAAISIDNRLITNLQAQIDKLLGVTKGSKDAEKAIRDLAESQMALRVETGVAKLFETPEFKLKVPALEGVPETLNKVDVQPFSASLDEATERMALFQKTAETFSEGLSDVLVGGFTNIAIGFGDAIGQIISGASGIEALPAIILSAIGDMAIRVGELAIGTGIAISGIKAALESLNPALAIAGGIALVALGVAVKGAASSIGSSGGGAGGSLASQPAANYGSRATANQQPLKIVAEFKLRGPDLIASARIGDYRELRTR